MHNDPVNCVDLWGLQCQTGSDKQDTEETTKQEELQWWQKIFITGEVHFSVGVGLSANVSGLKIGFDLGSMDAGLSSDEGYSEEMTVGIYGAIGSVEGSAPLPENGEAALKNMNSTVAIGPVQISEDEINITFGIGFQVLLGLDVSLSIKIPLE